MTQMHVIKVHGFECKNRAEAMEWVNAMGHGHAIQIGDKILVVHKTEAERLDATGVPFAYLLDHEMPDGTFHEVNIPVH